MEAPFLEGRAFRGWAQVSEGGFVRNRCSMGCGLEGRPLKPLATKVCRPQAEQPVMKPSSEPASLLTCCQDLVSSPCHLIQQMRKLEALGAPQTPPGVGKVGTGPSVLEPKAASEYPAWVLVPWTSPLPTSPTHVALPPWLSFFLVLPVPLLGLDFPPPPSRGVWRSPEDLRIHG